MHPSTKQSLADSGDFVAGWLNDPESDWGYGPDSQQQAADLVLALITLREKVLKGVKVAQGEQDISAINDMLARYPYVLRLGKVSRDGGFDFYVKHKPGRTYRHHLQVGAGRGTRPATPMRSMR